MAGGEQVTTTTGVARDRAMRKLRDKYPDEYAALYAEEMGYEQRACRVCGNAFRRATNASICGPECRRYWTILRYVVDPVARQRQLVATAKWYIAKGEGTAYHHRIVNGEATRGNGRWLIAGGAAYEAAVTAIERGWPIADQIPPAIREQIEQDQGTDPDARASRGGLTDDCEVR